MSGGECDGIMAYAIRGAALDPTQPVFLNTTFSSASMDEEQYKDTIHLVEVGASQLIYFPPVLVPVRMFLPYATRP